MTAVLPVRPGAATPLPPGTEATSLAGTVAGTALRLTARALPWAARGLVVVAALTFALLAVGPHVLGYRTMTMLTGSMSPGIDPGDVVITTPLDVADVTTGMVITYQIPIDDHRVVTHRVISVEHGFDGTVTVQTKGDANPAADPWKATLSGDTAYQVRAVIPHLGLLIEALRAPVLTQALVYGAPALLVGWLLLSIWRPRADDEAEIDETESGQDENENEDEDESDEDESDPADGDVAPEPEPEPEPETAAEPEENEEREGGTRMAGIRRRTVALLILTLAVVIGPLGAHTPAHAAWNDPVSVSTGITTDTVGKPTNVQGSVACTRTTGTITATWTAGSAKTVSGYLVTVTFSDGFVQTASVAANATSWSTSAVDPYFITANSITITVTTQTPYGWTAVSLPTGALKC